MPAQLKTVRRAQKPQGDCSHCKTPINAGDPYRYWKPGFRSRTKIRVCMQAACTPKRSQLENSKMSDAYAAIEDAESIIQAAETIDEIRTALEECSQAVQTVADEYSEAISETPMLEATLQEKVDELESFAGDLDATELEDPEDDADDGEKADALENARSEALDALSGL